MKFAWELIGFICLGFISIASIAASGTKRLAEISNIPTFTELGVPALDAPAWYGLLAPVGVSPAILKYLNTEVEQILKEPAIQQKLLQMG
jgi:tripartite-type tricarboxylate transporter receptor subunit TctC